MGAPHNEGEGPSPEEILTAITINDRKVAFKSGYDKYLRVEKNGIITGRSDAIGAVEQWEPVFEVNHNAAYQLKLVRMWNFLYFYVIDTYMYPPV